MLIPTFHYSVYNHTPVIKAGYQTSSLIYICRHQTCVTCATNYKNSRLQSSVLLYQDENFKRSTFFLVFPYLHSKQVYVFPSISIELISYVYIDFHQLLHNFGYTIHEILDSKFQHRRPTFTAHVHEKNSQVNTYRSYLSNITCKQ